MNCDCLRVHMGVCVCVLRWWWRKTRHDKTAVYETYKNYVVDDDKSVAGKQFRHMIIPPRTDNRETNMKKKEEKNDKKKHHSKSKSKPTVRSTEYFRIALDYYYYYYLDAYTAGKICLCMSMSILELNYMRKPLNSCVFWYVLCG